MSLDFIVAIPARLASTRLPEKPLRLIAGKPMIAHVVARALAAGASEVVVATDDARIAAVAQACGVRAAMTRADHPSGSDRLAEVASALGWSDTQAIVNLQGDEPLAPVSGIRAVAQWLADSGAPMATLATTIESAAQLLDPNTVKLVRGADGDALYFSRAPLPWARDAFAPLKHGDPSAWPALPADIPFLRHIGIYAYRAGFLRAFVRLPQTPLERAESLEQLRALEHGHRIAVALAPEPFPAGVDTEDDLQRVDAIVRRA